MTCVPPSARRVVPSNDGLTPGAAFGRVVTTNGGQAFAQAPAQTLWRRGSLVKA